MQVSYSVEHQWSTGFKGVFTIVNKSSNSISGWKLAAVLPNDTVTFTWPISFQMIGGTLIVQAPAGQGTIAPGGTFTEVIFVDGQTTSPTSCTFNGSPC